MLIILAFLLATSFPVDTQIRLWSTYYGVDYVLVQSVHYHESRNRDLVGPSSTGDYGRAQINCAVWKKQLGIPECWMLNVPAVNAWAGVKVLARFQSMFASGVSKNRCKCGNHHWVVHYNAGNKPTCAALSYGKKVIQTYKAIQTEGEG